MTAGSAKWIETAIGDLGRVVTGKTPPTSEPALFGESYPFITPTDIQNGLRIVRPARALSEEGRRYLKNYLLPSDAVCFVCIGATIGKVCMTSQPSFTNQQINSVVVDSSRHDPHFVYYLLRHHADSIKIRAGGAATPIINKTVFENVKLPLPDLSNQKKIAAVLSAYDGLIENNTQRAKLLEQMAQLLYREWFERPLHSGKLLRQWQALTLGDVLAELESGSRPRGGIDPTERGVPSIGAENVIGLGQYDYSKEKFVSRRFFEAMRRGHVKNRDVLLYKDGAHIGKKTMFGDGFPYDECCINEHVFILRTNDRCTQAYLFFRLDQPDMTQAIRNLNANAAQPGLNQTGIKGLPIIVPPKLLLNEFDQYIEPMLSEIFNLAKKSNLLRRTRNLLLPKLVSEEIDISGLDIRTEGLADARV